MADGEAKERAERVAAGKKKFEQYKKQKDKARATNAETIESDKNGPSKGSDKSIAKEATTATDSKGAKVVDEDGQDSSQLPSVEKEVLETMELVESHQSSSNAGHNRQPSLSLQSRLRSSSFRRGSVSQAPLPSALSGSKSPTLPVLGPDTESVNEIYRKQTSRLDELEKENRRLGKETQDFEARWKKAEKELEELRESSSEVAELKSRVTKADAKSEEADKLKHENNSLQRQVAQLQSQSSKPSRHSSSLNQTQAPSSLEIEAQIESKNSVIESMEMEISNLRSKLDKAALLSAGHSDQIAALETKLDRAERAAGAAQRELLDVKKSLARANEKAVKEGSERSSAETKIRSLEREVEQSRSDAEDATKRVEVLEKKLAALTILHKDSDSRRQAEVKVQDRVEKEVTEMRKRLATLEDENLRLREERERFRKREANGADDDGVDELEDEERRRLEDHVRKLESEVTSLRLGAWKDMQRNTGHGGDDGPVSPNSKFDEVDLTGGPTLLQRQSLMAGRGQGLSNVISSGFNALTGGGRQESQDLLNNSNDGFDEDAFRLAQEEEARERIERVKEIKRGLKDWDGWRMDIVDCRVGGGGAGEIFDV